MLAALSKEFNQEVQDMYVVDYKILLKEIKEDIYENMYIK